MEGHHLDATTGEDDFAEGSQVAPAERDQQDPKTWGTVGRNEACPCGSGKKYKHCPRRLRKRLTSELIQKRLKRPRHVAGVLRFGSILAKPGDRT